MAIPKRTRYEVLARDNSTCVYCKATDQPLTMDHVVPVALGGTDDPSNLVTACKDCNAGKSSSNPSAEKVAQVSADTIRWSEAMTAAWSAMQGDRAAAVAELQPFYDTWFQHSGPGWKYRLPNDVEDVLLQYVASQLPMDVICEAARVALRKPSVDDYFRYFRGVANNMLRDIQQMAQRLMRDESQPAVTPMCTHADGCECLAQAWSQGFDDAFRSPLLQEAYVQARALSRIVDGENVWNRRVKATV